jgi:hypothetical protein
VYGTCQHACANSLRLARLPSWSLRVDSRAALCCAVRRRRSSPLRRAAVRGGSNSTRDERAKKSPHRILAVECAHVDASSASVARSVVESGARSDAPVAHSAVDAPISPLRRGLGVVVESHCMPASMVASFGINHSLTTRWHTMRKRAKRLNRRGGPFLGYNVLQM